MRITLVPTAGLCNRMNAILCAIISYEKYKIPTEIYWEKTSDCYAEFSDLFEPLNHPNLQVKTLKKFYLKPGGKKQLYLPNLLRNLIFDASYNGTQIANKKLSETCKDKKKIYITSYNCFTPVSPINFKVTQYFTPKKELAQRINEIVQNQFSIHTIGIHIRRTDNISAINNSPIEKFIQIMDDEISTNPDTNFYLATDSIDVKNCFTKRYGQKIITSTNALNRNTLEGMRNAIIDLYCLGNTKKIIGSDFSTYSVMASRLYQNQLILAHK